MTYPNAHLYLTAHWGYGASSNEKGQVGLRFDTVAPASQALVDACSAAWSAFWTNATALIDFAFKLEYLRLASIAPNGQYVPGTIAYDHVYPGSVNGGGSGGTPLYRFPLQSACVTSLLTAMPRGQAHKGRVYLPYIATALQVDWNWQNADMNTRSNSFAACLSALNAALPGPLSVFSKGTKAAPTVGAKQLVTAVQTGGKPDVQRRRAASATERIGIITSV